MGLAVNRWDFKPEEYELFANKVRENLSALKLLLERPGFGKGAPSFGAELEVYILDDQAKPARLNQEIIAAIKDPKTQAQVQLELNKFNLEYNLCPVPAKGTPFSTLRTDLHSGLAELSLAASQFQARILPIGILPTLTMDDLSALAMSDFPRYRALAKGLTKHQTEPFNIHIDGCEPLAFTCDTITLEGANTSFQFHWRVNPEDFANAYNAVQLLTPLALALGVNSPILLGHELWDETRITLFKQSIDTRKQNNLSWKHPARVDFGFGWLHNSAYELFEQNARLYPPILPVIGNEDALQTVKQGQIPKLEELRLHHGTVWTWNRAVYDATAGGHLRIEMRSTPAGPTIEDMLATNALLVGLAQSFQAKMTDLMTALPFQYAENNFYRAAQKGLGARLIWPSTTQTQLREMPVREIIAETLPLAEQGLDALGVDRLEIDWVINNIKARLASGMTGALWQRRMLRKLKQSHDIEQSLIGLVENYNREYQKNISISDWSEKT